MMIFATRITKIIRMRGTVTATTFRAALYFFCNQVTNNINISVCSYIPLEMRYGIGCIITCIVII